MSELISLHPGCGQEFDKATNGDKLDKITSRKFQILKERLITIDICLQKNMELHEREALIKVVLEQGYVPTKDRSIVKAVSAALVSLFRSKPSVDDLSELVRGVCSSTTDAQFLSKLQEMRSREALLETEVTTVLGLAHQHFQALIKKVLKFLSAKFQQIQEQDCTIQIRNLAASQREERHRVSRRILMQEMQETTIDPS